MPVETWRAVMKNDFEESVFIKYPEIAAIKDKLYDMGAIYASMSGSGSSVFGIFREQVEHVDDVFNAIFVKGNMLGDSMFYGSGAGKLPTASAVVGDIVEAAKNPNRSMMATWTSEKLELEEKD